MSAAKEGLKSCATPDQGAFAPQEPMKSDAAPVVDAAFKSFVEGILAHDAIPGLSVAVVCPDGGIELGAWGVRTEEGDPFETDTLVAVASVSKAFVPAAMGIMIDDFAKGKNVTSLPPSIEVLDWDTKIKELLPDEWELQDHCATEGINLRDIFAHHTGLSDHTHSHGRDDMPQDIIARFKHLRSTSGIRQSWLYNNMMYMTGTYIISKYSGMTYQDFVADRIFKPLGMKDTTYSPSRAESTGRFSHSWTRSGRRIPHFIDDQVAELCAGGGGVITTSADMARWVRMWLHQGVDPVTNETVLPKSVYDVAIAPASIVRGLPGFIQVPIMNYGLGWIRNSLEGLDMIWHAGAIPGVSALAAFFPQVKAGVVVLANADNTTSATVRVGMRILKSVLKQPLQDTEAGEQGASPAAHRSVGVPPPAASSAPAMAPSLAHLAGIYSDPGYGTLNLRASESASRYSDAVIADFASVDAAKGDSAGPQLLAAWNRVFSSHVRFVPRADRADTFDVRFTMLYPRGYGADATPFETTAQLGPGAQATAEFVMDEEGEVLGFGMFGVAGGKTERMRTGKTVWERADVWFVRERGPRVEAHE
ncbi:beta-lactamase/transpeptidase-like protein [Punctularia strigosozonata HHB-11173 SS5]|uniref:beta-lactamase/transpeptidase-like protein n=1 Tax=Punctularia strigosozonata (strain HHB-11173) TaxID=741275 RepID=UPI0004417155|nr:beta-lactamase/transpeptidase-like protein [Punctularia strigosozonata HHB-11173 SS5]EIN06837.1 beta-lactamase/transpeptidase-like protein [Punctularia strigosozonata HHB-11173 SS5]